MLDVIVYCISVVLFSTALLSTVMMISLCLVSLWLNSITSGDEIGGKLYRFVLDLKLFRVCKTSEDDYNLSSSGFATFSVSFIIGLFPVVGHLVFLASDGEKGFLISDTIHKVGLFFSEYLTIPVVVLSIAILSHKLLKVSYVKGKKWISILKTLEDK